MCLIVLGISKGMTLDIIILFSSPLGIQDTRLRVPIVSGNVVHALMRHLGGRGRHVVEIPDLVCGSGPGDGFLEEGPT